MGCSKPNCDCLEKEEQRIGGPVKYGYPCLHDKTDLTESKSKLPPATETDRPGKALEIIEVIQTDLYRDGGSKAYIDAEGFKYIYPVNTAFRKHEPGIYTDWPDKGGNRINVLLKVVKELNGIKNGWWKEDHYVPYPNHQPPLPVQGKEDFGKYLRDQAFNLKKHGEIESNPREKSTYVILSNEYEMLADKYDLKFTPQPHEQGKEEELDEAIKDISVKEAAKNWVAGFHGNLSREDAERLAFKAGAKFKQDQYNVKLSIQGTMLKVKDDEIQALKSKPSEEEINAACQEYIGKWGTALPRSKEAMKNVTRRSAWNAAIQWLSSYKEQIKPTK